MKQNHSKCIVAIACWLTQLAALCLSPDPVSAQGICATSAGGNCNTALGDFAISDGTPDLFFFDTDVGDPDWQVRINEGGVPRFTLVESNPGPSFVDPLIIDGASRNNAIRISAGGRIGFGTATPAQELHVVDAGAGFGPAIRFQDNNGQDWDLEADDTSFAAFDVTNGTRPFQVEAGGPSYSLHVAATGNVGLGTTVPQAKLHVSGATRLDGDLRVLSSKASKENLTPVDSGAILALLADLPIQEWSYRGESDFRHLGPVAEDFHSVFSLGRSELAINPLDASGVALAAIQGLQTALAEERARTERLLVERDQQIEQLAARLAALEARQQGSAR